MPIDKEKRIIQLRKAIDEGKITNKDTMATFVMIQELHERLDEEIPQIKNIIQRMKGEDGHTPTDREIIALIKPLIPEPIKGDNGDTPTKTELLNLIKPLIPKIKDGKTPTKQELLNLILPLIPEIDTAKIALDAKNGALQELLPKIPTIDQVAELLPERGDLVRNSLEVLIGDDRLDKSAIKGLDKFTTKDTLDRAVSILDSRTSFLINKINNLPTASTTDEKVKYDASDPTAGYVADKFIAGNGITLSEGTGDDENKLKISTTWLLDPVEEHWDITEGLPPDPEDGDRYISDGTDEELGWYDGYIYEYDEEYGGWYETIPVEGMMVWLIFEMVMWVFFSGGWMEMGSDTFLKLDQTTPQTVNGYPIISGFTAKSGEGDVFDEAGNVSFSFNTRKIYDSAEKLSNDYTARHLYDSSEAMSIDYDGRSLANGMMSIFSWASGIPKLNTLTNNGFVKTSGDDGTLSVDTNTYLTAEADTLDTVCDRGKTTNQDATFGLGGSYVTTIGGTDSRGLGTTDGTRIAQLCDGTNAGYFTNNGTPNRNASFGNVDYAGQFVDGTYTTQFGIDSYAMTTNGQIRSTLAGGTSPFAITSTTVNTNLNADLLDGKHIGTSGNTVPLLDGANTWSGTQLFGTTTQLQFRDSAIHIESADDGHLDLTADTSIDLNGITLATNKIAFTQTDFNEYIDSLADGYMDYGATTSHRFLVGGTEQLSITDGTLQPKTNDDIALGTSALQFSDLFLAEGGVINWDNGDATLTQANNVLTLAGAVFETDSNIKSMPHQWHISVVNPNAVVTASTIVPVCTLTDAALTVTKIVVSTSSASYEAAGDLKYADARIGLASATVINDFDTTSGVRTDTTITSASVASGKFVYLSFDSAPSASMTDMVIDIYFDYN